MCRKRKEEEGEGVFECHNDQILHSEAKKKSG